MKILKVLKRKKVSPPPIWIMRQAGRYLPEFKETKRKAKGFINMIYNPKISAEVTLQPIKRFGFDAAIIFSDILTIPDSLGQELKYTEGKGPSLKKMSINEMINIFPVEIKTQKLLKTYKAIKETKKKLNNKTSLIGFVGAPLTISFFMLDSERKKNYRKILALLKTNKQTKKLFRILESSIAIHAIKQIKAGAHIIQIFDTWACVAKGKDLMKFSVKPIKRICGLIKKKCPKTPIIVFPRNVGSEYTKYIFQDLDCISIGNDATDKTIKKIQKEKIIQGNLSPEILFKGGKKLEKETIKILKRFANKPFIFNLSHGIMPKTPIGNVKQLIKLIRKHGK